MHERSGLNEKRRYWEMRLGALLPTIPIVELLKMNWALDALREGRTAAASKYINFPGQPIEHNFSGKFFIPPWHVDGLLNERLVLGAETNNQLRRLDLRQWNAVAKLLNAYGGLSNVEGVKDFESDKIIAALPRLFWPQYDWQIGYENMFRIGRAWKVYATPEGKQAFFRRYEIELEQFLKVAFAIYAATQSYPAVRAALISNAGMSAQEVHRTCRVIGGTLVSQSEFAKGIRHQDVPLDVRRSAIKEKPIFDLPARHGRELFVPSRSQLLLRITDGLYYDIVSDSDARRSSGHNFEELCFQLLAHYLGSKCRLEGEIETSFGKSADIFATDENEALGIIIECKIRRLPQRVLISPNPWVEFEDDFSDVIKGIVQIWRTHVELTSKSPNDMTGVVVLYDPWTVMGNAFLNELYQRASQRADELNIPAEQRVPVALVGYADLEECLSCYGFSDIHHAIKRSVEECFHGYQLSGVLNRLSRKRARKTKFGYKELATQAIPWWGDA